MIIKALVKVFNTTDIVVENDSKFQIIGQDEWLTLDDLTPEQKLVYDQEVVDQKAIKVRRDRNNKIAKTDWTQSQDVDQNVRDLWNPYRQALRDITDQSGFPEDVVWPEPPTP